MKEDYFFGTSEEEGMREKGKKTTQPGQMRKMKERSEDDKLLRLLMQCVQDNVKNKLRLSSPASTNDTQRLLERGRGSLADWPMIYT